MEFLTSDFFTIMKNDTFVKALKNEHKLGSILFVPTTKKTDETMKYLILIMKEFEKYGLIYENSIVLSEELSVDTYKSVTCIFLMGGSVAVQHEFIHQNREFLNFLIDFSGTIIGYSAGSLNLGRHIFLHPRHKEGDNLLLEGVGKFDFCLDVHCPRHAEVHYKIEYEKIEPPLFLLKDEGALIHDQGKITLIGEVEQYKRNRNT